MFRLNSSHLPQDYEFPSDLKSLGYFIDERTDIVKSIEYPDELFRYKVSNDDRYNSKRREAIQTAIHHDVLKRLGQQGLMPLYLPHLTETKPQPGPFLEILTTPRLKLRHKKRVVVVVNRAFENLGVWSWRTLLSEKGIEGSCAVSFARSLNEYGMDAPGLIITNPGQLLFSHRANTSMSNRTWELQTRKSAVYPSRCIDPEQNKVKGNTTFEEHLTFVCENLISNEEFVDKNAEIYFVGLADGGNELIQFLDSKWPKCSSRITALALTAPQPMKVENTDFASFLAHRARAWCLSAHPLNTPLGNVDATWPLQRVCGGEELDVESVMPEVQLSMLEWFEDVAMSDGQYCNETLDIPKIVQQEAEERAVEMAGGPSWDD